MLKQVRNRIPSLAIWTVFASLCLVFGAYALGAGLGLIDPDRVRLTSTIFVIHACTGAIALMMLPAQALAALRSRVPGLHRICGRIYSMSVVAAAWSGSVSVMLFEIPVVAKVSFFMLAVFWVGTTVAAVVYARRRHFGAHRRWVVRSAALTLFFPVFPIWTGLLSPLGPQVQSWQFTLALTLSWLVNVAFAEFAMRVLPKRERPLASAESLRSV